jgi:hypothetical protein
MTRQLRALLVVVAVVAGCNSNNNPPPVVDASITELGNQTNCTATGLACTAASACCSGACTNQLCSPGLCAAAGGNCMVATDCCSLNCTGGKCVGGTGACVSDGQACTAGGTPCCSTLCEGGTCKALNPTCKTAGNSCPNGNADCCSKYCFGGKCAVPSQVSYCTQPGEICFNDNACCTGTCTGATATTPGTCATLATATCSVDGLLCSGCTGCCSSFCGPYGTSASMICQPASGCHVQGDLCQKDSDCCGGDATLIGKLPGAGLVKCVPLPNVKGLGTCSDPNPNNCPSGKACGSACVPEGDVCHYKDNGGCPSNSIRNDCCDATGNKGMCKLDALGIPRCYGISECVKAGGDCASSADCCNNLPCIPDSAGHLKCNLACIPQSGICTTTADCCTGLPCVVPPGALAGTCTPPLNPPPVGGDGGVKDVGPAKDASTTPTCALYGQACSTTLACCQNNGSCRSPYPNAAVCVAGETDCTCFNPLF